MDHNLRTLLEHKGLLHDMRPAKLHELQGEIMSIFLGAPHHAARTLTEIAALALPAIHFNQFRIYRQGGRPVAWVSWAFMDEDECHKYVFAQADYDFAFEKWKGGEHVMFIEFIAPFGHALKVAHDLKRNVFPGRTGFAPDLDMETGARRIRKLFGAHIEGATSDEEAEFINGA